MDISKRSSSWCKRTLPHDRHLPSVRPPRLRLHPLRAGAGVPVLPGRCPHVDAPPCADTARISPASSQEDSVIDTYTAGWLAGLVTGVVISGIAGMLLTIHRSSTRDDYASQVLQRLRRRP